MISLHQNPKVTTMAYRKDIDGLRAVAVLLVLVFHFELFGIGKSGFIGVDVFFVISGYLISSIIWQALENENFSLKEFYVSRLRRLAPTLIVVQILTILFGLVFLMPSELVSLSKEVLAAQFYVSNIYYWQTINYFGLQASNSFMLHSWSLAIEEQFYLIFPVILIVIFRYCKNRLGTLLATFALISFVLNLYFVTLKPEATFYLLPTRGWELLAGALIPFIAPYFRESSRLCFWGGLTGMLVLAMALIIYDKSIPFPGSFALLPVLAAMLIILSGMRAGSPVSTGLSNPIFVYIGRISYSLYLVHWPIKTFSEILIIENTISVRWLMFLVSFILSIAIFHFVENPIRRNKEIFGVRPFLKVVAISTCGLIFFSIFSIQNAGIPSRFSEGVNKMAMSASDRDPFLDNWHVGDQESKIDSYRRIGHLSADDTWMIVGDSHAAALAEASQIWLKQRGESGVIGFWHGCMPILRFGDKECRDFNLSSLEYLDGHPEIKNVMLISIWQQIIEQKMTKEELDTKFKETLAAYKKRGVRLHIWEPIPKASASVPVALARNMAFGDYWPVEPSLAKHRESFAMFRTLLDEQNDRISGRIDPANTLCKKDKCDVIFAGNPLFSDSNHPAFSASRYFAEILVNADLK